MSLADKIAQRQRTLSYEFFPPKNERSWYTLLDTIDQLSPLGPDFVSVTYGAGGSTRGKTREIVEHIQEATPLTAVAHLTCVNASYDDLRALFDEYHAHGITNILALRGDPPKGQERFIPTEGGPAHATDLLEMLRDDGRFSTFCAAYPEGHPENPSKTGDWDYLIKKFELGASMAMTQCFFDVEPYLEMLDYCEQRMGYRPRVVPGLIPITDFKGVKRFCNFCGAIVPQHLHDLLGPLEDDPVAVRRAGISFTIDFARRLLEAGAPGLHIYCLNKSTAAAEVTTCLRESGAL